MKKTSKMFVGLALAGMLLTGCNFQGPNAAINSQAGTYEKQQIYQLYKAAGGTMSYDEWLESVRGADGASLLADTRNPSDADGKNGDVFVNISTWDLFIKVGGAWQPAGNIKGAQGEKGDRGEIGPQGPQGEQGPQGPAGKDGADGKDGKDGVDGKDGKDGVDGKDGKDGLDGKDGKDGKDGADGKDGTSFLSGNGRPSNDLGNDGDTYFDFVNKDFYQKANGFWKKVANLNGELQWNAEVSADMIKYLGETLPFADYEEETIEFGYYNGYESSYGIGLWYLWDSSENFVLEDYGDKLLAAGFTQGGIYTTSTTNYIKTTASGIDIEVGFGFDAGNVINVYMPKYVPPFSADYFLELGFEAVDGWPADHVALTVGADRFAGVNNDGTWYEKFGINGGEYYYDLLATEGLYAEALGAQALAAGFLYEEDYKVYFDAKGNAEAEFDPDNDAYLTMQEKDGWTYARFFGETLPFNEEYFEENGFTKNAGFPEELIAEAFFEENRFEGVNVDADWYVKSTKTEYTSGAHIGTYRINGEILTAGDVTEEMIANVLAAGFIWEDYYEDYELPNDGMTYMYITYKRGYTSIRFYGSYIPTGEVIDLPGVDEVNDKIAEYYAGQNIAVAVPEYVAASANAYYESADEGAVYKIYGSDTDEMADFAAALEAAGWQINYYSDYFEDDFKAYIGDDNVCLKVEDYYSYVKISCLIEAAPAPVVHYAAADIDTYVTSTFASIDVAVVAAEYVAANPDAYFILDGVNAKLYGSNKDEMDAFAAAMGDYGWSDTLDSWGDHNLAFGASGAKLYVGDYTSYILFKPSYTAPVTFDLAEFPLAEVNAFLTQYGLGFTLAEAIPDAAGAGYAMESDVASGYHYLLVIVSGDQAAAITAILDPIVTAAGYEEKTDSSTGMPYYANDVDHQVSIRFYSDSNTTEILFFE